jgi:glycogen debranching enzyme
MNMSLKTFEEGILLPATLLILITACNSIKNQGNSLSGLVKDMPSIKGKKEYLQSPFVTAGNRLYMIGYQDGTFPDLGWHIRGEMGGIWDHPIKIMDGFSVSVNGKCLPAADEFVNFPVANLHRYNLDSLFLERSQFVPEGLEAMEIDFTIQNQFNEKKNILFGFTGKSDLMPVWLSERKNITDGKDIPWFDKQNDAMIVKDSLNDWYAVFGADRGMNNFRISGNDCRPYQEDKGVNATLEYNIELPANGATVIRFFIAGSAVGKDHLLQQFDLIKKNNVRLFKEKKIQYEKVRNTALLSIPDSAIQEMFTWLKYNSEWLVRDLPGLGRGLSAGLPDYPWWFGCDNEYALQGVLAGGQHDIAKSTIQLLYKFSENNNGNGRITHEVSTNGEVYNPGNLNETPQFVSLLWDYFQWTGDIDLLRTYYPFIRKGIDWLMSQDKDGNLCPDGSGMMEIEGLNSEMIDVAVYTQQAFESVSRIAEVLNDSSAEKDFRNKAEKLKEQINREWWVKQQGSYADFRSDKTKALEIASSAIDRAKKLDKPWAVKELKNIEGLVNRYPDNSVTGYVMHHNWVVNTPMETGIADSSKAFIALMTAEKFSNPFGMYVTGIDRDENPEDEKVLALRKKVFSYTGAVMTLPTGVQAVAEARYGRNDMSLEYIRKLANSFSYALPGSMYEVSPDFGMMTQAWNIYGVAVPIIRYFLGINPDAFHKRIVIKPDLPSAWKNAGINHLPVGDNFLDMDMKITDAGTIYKFKQSGKDWKIVLQLKSGEKATLRVNNREQKIDGKNNYIKIEMTGLNNEVWIR